MDTQTSPPAWPTGRKVTKCMHSPAFLVLFLLCSSLLLLGWADSWDAVQAELGQITSLKADFVQEKDLQALSQPLVSNGTIVYQAPGSLRWEYTSPIKSVTLLDQGQAVRYTTTEGETHKEEGGALTVMQTVLDKMRSWLQGDFKASSDFTATLSSNRTITLTPKNEGMAEFINRITLRLSDQPGVIRSVNIEEGPDSATRITFSNVEINCGIDPTSFEQVQ